MKLLKPPHQTYCLSTLISPQVSLSVQGSNWRSNSKFSCQFTASVSLIFCKTVTLQWCQRTWFSWYRPAEGMAATVQQWSPELHWCMVCCSDPVYSSHHISPITGATQPCNDLKARRGLSLATIYSSASSSMWYKTSRCWMEPLLWSSSQCAHRTLSGTMLLLIHAVLQGPFLMWTRH